jgi:hypothetical protein
VTAICAIVAYLLGFCFWLGMCRGRRDPWPDAILLAAIWPLAFAWHRAKFGTFAAFLLLVLAATSARATPYFRPLDLASPHIVAGAFIDPKDPGNSAAGSALALVTHSTTDGCLLPSIVCEDWTPLAVGFSVNGGRVLIGAGPSVNLAPVFKSLALRGLNAVTGEENYLGLKSSLGSVPITGPDVTMSFGPAWVVSPSENWKGYFRVFAGAAWRIGK